VSRNTTKKHKFWLCYRVSYENMSSYVYYNTEEKATFD